MIYAPIAQLAERDPVKFEAEGSSPSRGAKQSNFKIIWSIRIKVIISARHAEERGALPL